MPETFTPAFGPAANTAPAREFPVARPELTEFRVASGAGLPDALLREAREQAHRDGYTAGLAQARDEARSEAERILAEARAARDAALARAQAEVDGLLQALARAAATLEATAVATAAELAGELIEAAGTLAAAVVGHELRAGGDGPLDALRRAAAPIPSGEPVTVYLNPGDRERLQALGVPAELDGRTLTVLADPALAPGDATASSGATRVDARLAGSLARALAVLGS